LRIFFLSLIYRLKNILGYDSRLISEKIIRLNNQMILKKKFNIDYKDILVLLPHCVQNAECRIRITFNPKNCVDCGRCRIGTLLKFTDSKNIKLAIATGGMLARKIIKENRPRAIIAVACHRDLIEGIIEIRKIPVLGVLNIIGKSGPCVSTDFDLDKVMEYVEFFHFSKSV
jgi:hypothetical protein